MRASLLSGIAAAALSTFPLAAQDAADKVRLDEFGIPRIADGLAIEQLDPSASVLPQEVRRPPRDLSSPNPAPTDETISPTIDQLSGREAAGPASQVSASEDSRQLSPASISSQRDSRPEHVAPLQGQDRCDPQLGEEQLADCQRILELRAAEFEAAEAPRLSAEQSLLAERGESLETLAPTSSGLRARMAGGIDPNADSRSNQELASIYLDPPPVVDPPVGVEAGSGPAMPESFAEIIEALQAFPSAQP